MNTLIDGAQMKSWMDRMCERCEQIQKKHPEWTVDEVMVFVEENPYAYT